MIQPDGNVAAHCTPDGSNPTAFNIINPTSNITSFSLGLWTNGAACNVRVYTTALRLK